MTTIPFDAPYFTINRPESGLHVVETLGDGSTRTVTQNERFRLSAPSGTVGTGNSMPERAPTPAKPAATPANKRAAILLKVPFAQKEQAKELGARWDAAQKKWYVPQGLDIKLFEAWWP